MQKRSESEVREKHANEQKRNKRKTESEPRTKQEKTAPKQPQIGAQILKRYNHTPKPAARQIWAFFLTFNKEQTKRKHTNEQRTNNGKRAKRTKEKQRKNRD